MFWFQNERKISNDAHIQTNIKFHLTDIVLFPHRLILFNATLEIQFNGKRTNIMSRIRIDDIHTFTLECRVWILNLAISSLAYRSTWSRWNIWIMCDGRQAFNVSYLFVSRIGFSFSISFSRWRDWIFKINLFTIFVLHNGVVWTFGVETTRFGVNKLNHSGELQIE